MQTLNPFTMNLSIFQMRIMFLFLFLAVGQGFSQTLYVDNQLSCDLEIRIQGGPAGAYADCDNSGACGCCVTIVCIAANTLDTFDVCAGANAEAVDLRAYDPCASGTNCTSGSTNFSSPTGGCGANPSPHTSSTGCGARLQPNMTVTWSAGPTITIN